VFTQGLERVTLLRRLFRRLGQIALPGTGGISHKAHPFVPSHRHCGHLHGASSTVTLTARPPSPRPRAIVTVPSGATIVRVRKAVILPISVSC
jgi:hypothetical protein